MKEFINPKFINPNINPQSVSQNLICSICLQFFNTPMRLSCSYFNLIRHTFCFYCIWNFKKKQCATCKKKWKYNPEKDLIASNLINELEQSDCIWRGKYYNWRVHMKTCKYRKRNKIKLTENNKIIKIEEEQPVIILISQDQDDKN